MKAAAIIVAAGASSRFGGAVPKPYHPLLGRALLTWSATALAEWGASPLIAVIDAAHQPLFDGLNLPGVRAVPGGATRTASVRAGLAALAEAAPEAVLIHDAARPGLRPALITALLGAIEGGLAGVAPALPMADALKEVDAAGQVRAERERDGLVRVQTPQAFRFAAIVDAYARLDPRAALDDDLAVARAAGYAVGTVPGEARLWKATYPEDLAVLARLLGEAGAMRVGSGFDAHRFGTGDHVTLCGVRIAHDKGLIGHSDADAGWHALTDAILGALALGDIGDHFPPSDEQWRGADSEVFLRHAAQLAVQAGAQIAHVDITLICERPKIAPHREAMRARTAAVLGLALDRVSVKATTTERMGFLGREEGLAAQAVATLT